MPPERRHVRGRCVGPENEPVRLDHRVELALHQPGLDDATPSFEVYLQRPPHLGDVEGEPGRGGLPGEARSRAAGRDGESQLAGRRKTASYILLGAGDDDAYRLAEVDGGVCGPKGARGFVGAQVTFEFTVEGGVELPRVRFGSIRHDPVNFTSRVDVPPVGDSHPGRRDGSFPLQWDKPPLRGAFPGAKPDDVRSCCI